MEPTGPWSHFKMKIKPQGAHGAHWANAAHWAQQIKTPLGPIGPSDHSLVGGPTVPRRRLRLQFSDIGIVLVNNCELYNLGGLLREPWIIGGPYELGLLDTPGGPMGPVPPLPPSGPYTHGPLEAISKTFPWWQPWLLMFSDATHAWMFLVVNHV